MFLLYCEMLINLQLQVCFIDTNDYLKILEQWSTVQAIL